MALSNHARTRLWDRYGLAGPDIEEALLSRLRDHPMVTNPVLLGSAVQCQIDIGRGPHVRLICIACPKTQQVEVITILPAIPKKRKP